MIKLMKFSEYFKDKKVTVMRIGLLGRGIGDTAFMAEAGAEILVVDDAPESAMRPAVDALTKYTNVTFKFGPYENADFEKKDFILVGAGAPLDLPCLEHAREEKVPLMQSAALFAKLSHVPIIGVTGTRGKSTVTHMIHHVLSTVTEGSPVLLGGNVRGVSNLQLLNEVQEDSLCVMELDSWQLQGWGWSGISPQVAVFTSFMPDHMNYYHDDMESYFKDKAHVFLHQEESDVLVTTPAVFEWIKKVFPETTLGQEVKLVDSSIIPEDCLLSMPGEHNRLNAALAYEALIATGLTEEEIFSGLASFPGVPGRLEKLAVINGVTVYNDNNATTPAATIAGIKAVGVGQNVILIMGGADKGLATGILEEAIAKHVKAVVLLPGTGTAKLLKKWQENSTINRTILAGVKEVVSLKEAVEAGLVGGQPGDVLLFSPGFASFGMYKNEYERNDEFVETIKSLENK